MEIKLVRQIKAFEHFLAVQEKSKGTIGKYTRDVKAFVLWLGDREIDKKHTVDWKEHLISSGYAAVTINSMISSLNSFLRFSGREDCQLKFLRIQRKMFRPESRELNKNEYFRLVHAAQNEERIALLLETLCSTGVRVSEIKYITVEAALAQITEISMKGKIRTIVLPEKLCRKLLRYAAENNISHGEIFLTKNGKSLNRKQIWQAMKKLCDQAEVDETKVFPHNLRHLFARTYYSQYHDIIRLANVMGHSSAETTRLYLKTSSLENARQLDTLGLVS